MRTTESDARPGMYGAACWCSSEATRTVCWCCRSRAVLSHGQHMCRESINKHFIMQKAPVPHTEQPCWYRCFFLVYQALNSFFRKVFLRPFIRPFGMKLHRFMWKYMKLAFEKVQRSCTFVGFCGDAWRYRNWPIHFDT